MIYLEKYGGSLLKDPKSLIELAEKIKDQVKSFSKHDRLVLVVSAFSNVTKKLIEEMTSLYKSKDNVDKRIMDSYLVLGELESSSLLTAILSQSFKVKMLNACQIPILTDETFGNANIKLVGINTIWGALRHNQILVIPGFQGITKNLEFTTLGRGGSDLTTIVIYEHLKKLAEVKCHFYKDVQGLFSSDPKKDPNARFLKEVSLGNLLNLINNSPQILDKRAVEYAVKANLPFTIGLTKESSSKIVSL